MQNYWFLKTIAQKSICMLFFFVHFVYEILLLQDFTLALSEMRLEGISAYKEAAG